MKKPFLVSILACLFFFGCAAPSAKNPSPPPPSTIISPSEKDVWKTEDVDTSKIDSTKKLIALTFDDAPTKKLPALLDVFLQFNRQNTTPATATFFCNGQGLLSRHKEGLQTAFAMGMELGNHTFSHADVTTFSPFQLQQEIDKVDRLLEGIDGKKTHLFRAPYGKMNDDVASRIQTPVINWFIDTEDWARQSASHLVEKVLERLQDGAIVLMHDGYDQTIEGVRQLLPLLQEKGYQAVSVSQMAKAHGCRLQAGKVYTRARKTHY